jgi:hypothetical protein
VKDTFAPVLVAWLAQGPDLPGLGDEGPGDVGSLMNLCFILLVVGFVIGVLGHLTRSRTLVAIGVTVVMAGSAVFVLAVGRYG